MVIRRVGQCKPAVAKDDLNRTSTLRQEREVAGVARNAFDVGIDFVEREGLVRLCVACDRAGTKANDADVRADSPLRECGEDVAQGTGPVVVG